MKIRNHRIFTAVTLVILLFTTLSIAQSGRVKTGDERAAAASTAASKALGGENNLGNIKSIVISGTMTTLGTMVRTSADGQSSTTTGKSSQSMEIRLLLPDNMMKIQTRTLPFANLPSTTYDGVSGGESRSMSPAGGVMGSSGAAPKVENRTVISQDPTAVATKLYEMARLLLGMLLRSGPVTPLTLTYAGTHAGGGFTITRSNDVLGTIEFDPKTNYPSAIRYIETTNMPSIVSDPATGSVSMGPGKSQYIDMIMGFSDRTLVNGVMFPQTITWKSTGDSPQPIDREFKIEKIQINSGLTLKDFELPK